MREFHYAAIREQKWDSEILGLIAAIYKEAGKQGKHLVGNNKYGMYKRIYKRRLKNHCKKEL